MACKVFIAPENINYRDISKKGVFLAGSIEMDKAEEWQSVLGDKLVRSGFNVFNPRRKEWDATWKQEFENPQFNQQVTWELDALDKSDYIVMYFDPNTKSPISLLELGLYAKSGKIHVICPDGFWRKGNVEIVCNKCNIPMYETIEDWFNFITK